MIYEKHDVVPFSGRSIPKYFAFLTMGDQLDESRLFWYSLPHYMITTVTLTLHSVHGNFHVHVHIILCIGSTVKSNCL